MNKIKLVLVDDHQLVRDGVKVMLMNVADIEIVGEAADSSELFELLKTIQPDIIMMDISMPEHSGIEVTEIIKKQGLKVKVIMLTADVSDAAVFDSLKANF